MKEKKIPKTITLYDSQITIIQKIADDHYEGDFGRVARHALGDFIDAYRKIEDD